MSPQEKKGHNMKKNGTLACLIGLFAFTLTAFSGTNASQINMTFGGLASTTWADATETSAFQSGGAIGLSLDHFIIDPLEVGVRQSFIKRDVVSTTSTTTTTTTPSRNRWRPALCLGNDDEEITTTSTTTSSQWNGATELFADYHITLAKPLKFYVGGALSCEYGDNVEPAWSGGPEGGLEFDVANDVYLYGRVNYYFQIDNDQTDELRYSAGIGFRF